MTLEIKNEKSQPKPHTRLLPIMVPSRTILNGDIPITPVGKDGRRDDVGDDPLWPAKSNKLYWVSSRVSRPFFFHHVSFSSNHPTVSVVSLPAFNITREPELNGSNLIENVYISSLTVDRNKTESFLHPLEALAKQGRRHIQLDS